MKFFATTILLSLSCFLPAQPAIHFSSEEISNGSVEEFSGQTQYQLTTLDNQAVLQASSSASASGLVIEQRIDLLATPYINWQWRTEQFLDIADERSKTGDDFVARVYLVIDGGIQFWKTLCIAYVWSSDTSKGSVWGNPYAEHNVKMLAVRDKNDALKTWHTERRNLYQDLIATFGDRGSKRANEKAYRYIDAIAIMTDTDNGGGEAVSYYGGISFTAQ